MDVDQAKSNMLRSRFQFCSNRVTYQLFTACFNNTYAKWYVRHVDEL